MKVIAFLKKDIIFILIALVILLIPIASYEIWALIREYQNSEVRTTINDNEVPSSYTVPAPTQTSTKDTQSVVNEVETNNIKPPEINLAQLESKLKEQLGTKLANYTIYLNDLLREQVLEINPKKIVEPASIAKLPVAVLVMRDVDAGKITLESTFAFDNSKKFGSVGNLGNLTNGTPITFRQYLEELLKHSDNNAWYMLVNYLGGSYQVVNPRIINELGVNPLFLDPPQGTARGVGKILTDLYSAKTTTKKSADYLISLLEAADTWAKAGIGLGLPTGTRFANKIGTLNDSGKVSYQDAAIVWGKKTNYVLVIMDEKTDWGSGQYMISQLSRIIYSYVN